MAKRSEAMNIIAVSIVILFLISGFPVMVYGSGSEESISPSSMSGNISNTNITPLTQDSSQNNSAGFVKYTLALLNNTLINGNSVNTTFNGVFPIGVAFDSSNGYVYVANPNSGSVSVINGATNTVIASITVGFVPYGVAFDSSNGYVYVANSESVSVINGATNTVIASITVRSNSPQGVAFDSSNGYVYVTNSGSNTVSVINGATNTVIANITVGYYPHGVAFDPSNGYVYVANPYSDSVSVINGATNNVIANITVGYYPQGVAFDPSNGYVYVANPYSDSVSVINGATNNVIASITVGSWPEGVAFDSSNGYVYVTNFYSSTVSIISTSPQVIKEYTVTFTESGLPSGTSWSVTFNGLTQSSTGSYITFSGISPGTYTYTVTAPSGYFASPSIGSVTVSTSNVTVAIAFSQQTYSVTFTETGLPPGTSWSVTLNGKTETSTTNTISFVEPNGIYSFSIASIDGYSVSQSSGSITVKGTNIIQNITFKSVTTPTSPSSNDSLIYIIIAIVVIAAAIGVVVAMGRKKK